MLCSDGHAERFEPPPGSSACSSFPRRRCARRRRARRSRRGSRSRTRSSTSPTPRCSCWGSPAATSACRARARRPHPPAAPRAPVPALVGAGAARARPRRARGDDLRRRADRARVVRLRVHGRRRARGCTRSPRAGPRSAACRSRPPAPKSARCDRPACTGSWTRRARGTSCGRTWARSRARARAAGPPRRPAAEGGLRLRLRRRARRWTRRASRPRTSSATRSAATSRCCWPRAAARESVVALAPAGGARPRGDARAARSAACTLAEFTTRELPARRRLLPRRRGARLRRGAADRQRARARLAAGSVEGRAAPCGSLWGTEDQLLAVAALPPSATGAHCTPSGSSSTASATRPSSTSRSRPLSSCSASCEAGPRCPAPERIWTRSQTALAIHSPRPPSCSVPGARRPASGIVDPAAVADLADHRAVVAARCAGSRGRRRGGCCWRPASATASTRSCAALVARGRRAHSSARRRTSASVSSSKPSTRAWAGGGAQRRLERRQQPLARRGRRGWARAFDVRVAGARLVDDAVVERGRVVRAQQPELVGRRRRRG